MAVAGDITESIGAPITGMENLNASICQSNDTSSGSRVRRVGTIDMASKGMDSRPRLPRPISTTSLTYIHFLSDHGWVSALDLLDISIWRVSLMLLQSS